jgi:C4-dicarboxylate-binding protein DctP
MKKFVQALFFVSMVLLAFSCSQGEKPAESKQAEPKIEAAKEGPKAVPAVDTKKAKEKAEYVIRLAYTDAGTWPAMGNKPLAEHAYGLMFKSIVESSSNGKIFVELFPSAEMGQSKEVLEMVKSGTLEACIETGAIAGFYPKSQVINLPYAFKSDEIAWWVFDNSKFWKDLVADMEKTTGLLALGMGQNGTRHFTNSKRPIKTPEDMKGLKFRVMQAPIYVKMVEALGAKAIPLAHGEIYTSCQTGVVDGQENPIWNIAANKWYEVQKYMTLDGHTWSENMLVMNSKFFRSLPKEYQHIVQIASFHGQWADRVSEGLGSRITDYELLAAHMEIYSPTPAELELFKKAVEPVTEWLKGEIGAATVDGFLKAVKEAEAALGY